MWLTPNIEVKWGSYFPADADDQTKVVAMVQAAMGKGLGGGVQLIPLHIAVEKIAEVFGIENVEAVMDELEKEQADAAAKDLEKTKNEQQSLHDIASKAQSGGAPGSGGSGFGGVKKPPQKP